MVTELLNLRNGQSPVSVCQSVNQSRSSVQEMLAHLKIAHDFIKMSPYEELVALHCCFYLHSHASSSTVLHIRAH